MTRMGWILAWLLVAVAWAGSARAGPWMREKGAVFLSFGADIDRNGTVQTVFAETGLSPRLSLGVDAWRSPFGDWSALALAQVPLKDEGASRAALSLGAGLARAGGRTGPQARLGLHLGRGLDSGWLAGELTVTHRFGDGQAGAKITGTWGWNATDRCATILEARGETRVPVTLAPSVVCRISGKMRLRLGGAQPSPGAADPPAFSLQGWVEF